MTGQFANYVHVAGEKEKWSVKGITPQPYYRKNGRDHTCG